LKRRSKELDEHRDEVAGKLMLRRATKALFSDEAGSIPLSTRNLQSIDF
jgi:hypothetical protein